MKAEEARQIAKQVNSSKITALKNLYNKIEQAAKIGRFEVKTNLDSAQEKMLGDIANSLEEIGYKIEINYPTNGGCELLITW